MLPHESRLIVAVDRDPPVLVDLVLPAPIVLRKRLDVQREPELNHANECFSCHDLRLRYQLSLSDCQNGWQFAALASLSASFELRPPPTRSACTESAFGTHRAHIDKAR